MACGWIKRHCQGTSTKGGGVPLYCGNPGVVSQIRGMIYGAHAGVRLEACIQFCLLRLMPRESGEMPLSGCHESPMGQMPLTAGPEATSSDAEEQETDACPGSNGSRARYHGMVRARRGTIPPPNVPSVPSITVPLSTNTSYTACVGKLHFSTCGLAPRDRGKIW